MDTTTNTDPELAAAMARALDYTDAVGLSDGTDRPAAAAEAVASIPGPFNAGDIARPHRHTYASSGRPFYLVPCYRCGLVLNSGHHYPEVDGQPTPAAVQLAAEHNATHHANEVDEFELGATFAALHAAHVDKALPAAEVLACPLCTPELDEPAATVLDDVRPARELDDDAIVDDLLAAMIGAGYEPAATVDIPDDVDANLGHRYDAIRLDRPGYTTAEWTLTGDGVGIIYHTDAAGYIVTRTQVDGLRYRHGLRTFITAAELRP